MGSTIRYERTDTEIVLFVPIEGCTYEDVLRLSVPCRYEQEKCGWVTDGFGQAKGVAGHCWSDRFEERPLMINLNPQRRVALMIAFEYLEYIASYLVTDYPRKDPPPTLEQWMSFQEWAQDVLSWGETKARASEVAPQKILHS